MQAKAGDLCLYLIAWFHYGSPLATQIRVYARNTLCGREYTISGSPESQDPHPSILPEFEGMAARGSCSMQGHQVLLVIVPTQALVPMRGQGGASGLPRASDLPKSLYQRGEMRSQSSYTHAKGETH